MTAIDRRARNTVPLATSRAAALIPLAVLGLALAMTPGASAQDYPRRVVRVVVPFAPGGQVDTVTRIVTARLSAAFGKQFVVDNRPGAGGNLGADIAARSKPDGHTLIMVSPSFAINPSLSPYTPYDPRRSFVPVSLVASAPNVLLVHPSLPVKSVKELVRFAGARPGQIAYASAGVGTPPHLAGELFSSMANIKLLHVPYKGGGPATVDLIAGQVSLMFLGMAPSLPHINAGKLRPVATTGLRRAAALPGVPTIAESGFPKFAIVNWIGLLTPAGTPSAVVERLNSELLKALASPDGKAQLAKLGLEGAAMTTAEFRAFIEAEIVKWMEVVKRAGASQK